MIATTLLSGVIAVAVAAAEWVGSGQALDSPAGILWSVVALPGVVAMVLGAGLELRRRRQAAARQVAARPAARGSPCWRRSASSGGNSWPPPARRLGDPPAPPRRSTTSRSWPAPRATSTAPSGCSRRAWSWPGWPGTSPGRPGPSGCWSSGNWPPATGTGRFRSPSGPWPPGAGSGTASRWPTAWSGWASATSAPAGRPPLGFLDGFLGDPEAEARARLPADAAQRAWEGRRLGVEEALEG